MDLYHHFLVHSTDMHKDTQGTLRNSAIDICPHIRAICDLEYFSNGTLLSFVSELLFCHIPH